MIHVMKSQYFLVIHFGPPKIVFLPVLEDTTIISGSTDRLIWHNWPFQETICSKCSGVYKIFIFFYKFPPIFPFIVKTTKTSKKSQTNRQKKSQITILAIQLFLKYTPYSIHQLFNFSIAFSKNSLRPFNFSALVVPAPQYLPNSACKSSELKLRSSIRLWTVFWKKYG